MLWRKRPSAGGSSYLLGYDVLSSPAWKWKPFLSAGASYGMGVVGLDGSGVRAGEHIASCCQEPRQRREAAFGRFDRAPMKKRIMALC